MLFSGERTPEPEERRGSYRCVPAEALETTLRVPDFGDARGELLDLTASGAGISVAFVGDPNLARGDVLEVLFGRAGQPRVSTPARVAWVDQLGDSHVRYGLEFLDAGDLLPQLDTFCQSVFNRRSKVRLPMEGCHLAVSVQWPRGRCTANISNLSMEGLGFVVSPGQAMVLEPGQRVAYQFRLPGVAAAFEGFATACYATRVGGRRFFGLAFDREEGSFVARRADLQAFVDRRTVQLLAATRVPRGGGQPSRPPPTSEST